MVKSGFWYSISLINPVNILNATSGLGNRVNVDALGALALTTLIKVMFLNQQVTSVRFLSTL